MYPHRTLCSVLDELRDCYKTRNFASMLALIEEAQSMGNRMEASIDYKNDIERYHRDAKEAHDNLKELEAKVKKLEKKKKKLS